MKTAEEIMDSNDNHYGSGYVWEDVEKAMEEYAEQFKPKWISVEDRLPEKECNGYIVKWKSGGGWVHVFYYYDDKSKNSFTEEGVSHWMPLPVF